MPSALSQREQLSGEGLCVRWKIGPFIEAQEPVCLRVGFYSKLRDVF